MNEGKKGQEEGKKEGKNIKMFSSFQIWYIPGMKGKGQSHSWMVSPPHYLISENTPACNHLKHKLPQHLFFAGMEIR